MFDSFDHRVSEDVDSSFLVALISLLTRPYFKGNSGLLNIESNRVQSLIFTRAVFQVLRKMYAHNYLTFQNIILKTNSQMI